VGTLVSGLLMIAAKPPAEALLEDHPHEVQA
jgi:hypothetical protein